MIRPATCDDTHDVADLAVDSGLPTFGRARASYERCGYEQEARVRDYYEPGDDVILFRKALALPSSSNGAAAGSSR